MNNVTTQQGKKPGQILTITFVSLIMATFFLLGIWTTVTGAKPTSIAESVDNGRWEEIGSSSAEEGGISNNKGSSTSPSLAVSPLGVPIVAWEDDSSDVSEIYVRYWEGTYWLRLGSSSANDGGISNNSRSSRLPSLAIRSNNRPVVAWMNETADDYEIYVRHWNGSAWSQVGSGSAFGGGISDNKGDSFAPSLAVDLDDRPIVAWEDYSSGDPEIYVRRWNGSVWAQYPGSSAAGGGISANSGNSYSPSIAIHPSGKPYIAWEDDSSGDSEIYVRRWNGTAWVEIGSGSASGGGISNNSGGSYAPSLAFTANGTPIVAWYDDSAGDAEIYVRRWNGTSWVGVGSGSASGGGISDDNLDSRSPSLAIRPDGVPVVAWSNNTYTTAEIYVRRWNGSVWIEMDSGSASDTGISASFADSWDPSLAIASSGDPLVAWADSSDRDWEIYARRWRPFNTYLPVILGR